MTSVRDSRSSTVSHLVVSGVTGSMPRVLNVLVAIGKKKWLLEKFRGRRGVRGWISQWLTLSPQIAPWGCWSSALCLTFTPAQGLVRPLSLQAGGVGKSMWDGLWNYKIPKGRAQGSPGICTALNTLTGLKEWIPRVYNYAPMMERDSGVDFAQRTEAKPFFFRANGLNKTLCLVRIKSKSIEEREKTKKRRKRKK